MTNPTRYEIQEKLGQGGAGVVYRAYDHQLHRTVALKRLLGATGESESGQDSLLREALALSSLQHPNIVTVYDLGRDETGPFVVMEHLEGRPLDDVVAEAPLPVAEFGTLVRDCLHGLTAAHHRNLIHRDLKPSNLMMVWLPSGGFQIKLLDFGIAKFSQAPSEQTTDSGGAIMGSVHYMAPEQFERAPLDARTDLYAIGCVFYYALTGQHPFNGETAAEVMASHLYHRLAPLGELRPDLPPAIIRWVEHLTQRQPSDRPESAAQAWILYQEALAEPSEQAFPSTPLPPPTGLSTRTSPGRRVKMPLHTAGGARSLNLPGRPNISPPLEPTLPESGGVSRSAKFTAIGICAAGLVIAIGIGWWLMRPSDTAPISSSTTTASSTDPAGKQTQATAAPADGNATESPSGKPLSPFDLEPLRSSLNSEVELEGVAVSVGQSKSGKTCYLNFSRRPGDSVSLSFRIDGDNDVFHPGSLNSLVGARIRARGRVTTQGEQLLLSVMQDPAMIRSVNP